MRSLWVRFGLLLSMFLLLQLGTLGTIAAHTGEDANTGHIVVEFGIWAVAVLGALVAIVALFWVRSLLRRR